MNTRIIGVLIAAATTVGSSAFAQEPAPYYPPNPQTMEQPPAQMPEPPPPPQAEVAVQYAPPVAAAPAPAGQWVYTNQYGWIWMPYGADYTYVGANDAAYTYAYYPRFGWRWVSSPWVVGVGPSPFWGRLGPWHYAWYGHPRFHGFAVGARWTARPVYRGPAYHAPVVHVGWGGGGGGWRGNGGWHGNGGGYHGHHR